MKHNYQFEALNLITFILILLAIGLIITTCTFTMAYFALKMIGEGIKGIKKKNLSNKILKYLQVFIGVIILILEAGFILYATKNANYIIYSLMKLTI